MFISRKLSPLLSEGDQAYLHDQPTKGSFESIFVVTQNWHCVG